MYEIIFDSKAIEDINKLPKKIKSNIFNKIVSTKNNPFHFFERLVGRTDYKIRVGKYRVVADIFVNEKRIEITKVGHRKKIYRTFQKSSGV